MRPMVNVIGAPVQRRTITSDLVGHWCCPGQEQLQCNRGDATRNVEVQKLVDQSGDKIERLLCLFLLAGECSLLAQTSSKCMQRKEPGGNA